MTRSRTIIISVFALLIIWQTFNQLPHSIHPDQDSWGLTDWLINYEGGFVRRGLGGTILLWLAGFTGMQANHLAIGFSLVAYGSLGWWIMTRSTSHFSPALLISCLFLGFPAMQGTVVRKDCLLLLLLIACGKLLTGPRTSTGLRWTLINLTTSAGILLHETFAFVALPALALCNHAAIRESIPKRVGCLGPSFICLGLVIIYHGDTSTALAIHESWLPLWHETCPAHTNPAVPFSTIGSIGWTVKDGTEFTKGILQTGIYQPAAWALVSVVSLMLTLRFARTENSPANINRIAGLLLLQFCSVFPLFFLGIDYGRWLFLCGTSSIILHTLGFSTPQSALLRIPRFVALERLPEMVRLIPRSEWILLFFGVPILWSASNFINATPAGRILREILSFHTPR